MLFVKFACMAIALLEGVWIRNGRHLIDMHCMVPALARHIEAGHMDTFGPWPHRIVKGSQMRTSTFSARSWRRIGWTWVAYGISTGA